MKTRICILLATLSVVVGVDSAVADVNEVLRFTNLAHEELYVELSIVDNCCHHIYDLYIWPHATSVADFWVDGPATYSACAYGEVTGRPYGCISGYLSDDHFNIYFDASGDPYRSYPTDLPTEVFIFDNPYRGGDVIWVESDSHHHASVGCFVNTLALP